MAKIASLVLAVMAGLLTCGQQQNNPEVFTLQFLCSSPEIYRIDYVVSLDGDYLCRGGVANFEKGPLNHDAHVCDYFTQEALEGREEGTLTLELHLYGENEDKEMAVLDPIDVPARLGSKQIIQITGSETEGYAAGLAGSRP